MKLVFRKSMLPEAVSFHPYSTAKSHQGSVYLPRQKPYLAGVSVHEKWKLSTPLQLHVHPVSYSSASRHVITKLTKVVISTSITNFDICTQMNEKNSGGNIKGKN
jgi:hypothetical protein